MPAAKAPASKVHETSRAEKSLGAQQHAGQAGSAAPRAMLQCSAAGVVFDRVIWKSSALEHI
jgi:hypothetical protein